MYGGHGEGTGEGGMIASSGAVLGLLLQFAHLEEAGAATTSWEKDSKVECWKERGCCGGIILTEGGWPDLRLESPAGLVEVVQ